MRRRSQNWNKRCAQTPAAKIISPSLNSACYVLARTQPCTSGSWGKYYARPITHSATQLTSLTSLCEDCRKLPAWNYGNITQPLPPGDDAVCTTVQGATVWNGGNHQEFAVANDQLASLVSMVKDLPSNQKSMQDQLARNADRPKERTAQPQNSWKCYWWGKPRHIACNCRRGSHQQRCQECQGFGHAAKDCANLNFQGAAWTIPM